MAATDTRGRPADATGYGVRPAFSGRGSGAGGASGSGFNVGGSNLGIGGLFGPSGAMVLPAFQAQPADLTQNLSPRLRLIQEAQKYGLSEEEAISLLEKFGGNVGSAVAALAQGVENIRALLRGEITFQNFLNNAKAKFESAVSAAEDAVNTVGDFTSDPVGEARKIVAEGRERAGGGIQNVGGRFTEIGSDEDIIKFLPGEGKLLRALGNKISNVGGRVKGKADGGIMSLQSGGDVDLRDIAKRRSAEVYGDPVMFERFAPSPLQQMDPSFRQSQFFMPAGQVPNFNMGIMGLPGQMYANYYPAGPVGQMNPINKQIMGMPGGAPMPPPPGSKPPVTAPPPSQDTGMTGEIWDKPYEEAIPRPKRSDFVSGFRKGKKDSEAFKRALEEWNRNQKIWDSFETGAERKKYYLSGLDNLRFADGGSTNFPRKNGQISGPGTERSDDIPAMLSDGEFVVNAKAVRGIGSLMGSEKPKSKAEQRREGARVMYALQSAGEKASGLRG